MTRNMSKMNYIMTRLFTLLLLMAFSMGAQADVKVLFGENGTEKFEGTGGTIEVKQEESKDDATKVTVTLIVTPADGYTMERDNSLEVYAVVSPAGASTRAPEILGDALKLDCTDFMDISQKRSYTVDIDSNLGLWVKKVEFQSASKEPTRATNYKYVIINNKGNKAFNYSTDNSTSYGKTTLAIHPKAKSVLATNFRFYTTEAGAVADASGTIGTAGTDYYTEGTAISDINNITDNTFFVRYDLVENPTIDINAEKMYKLQVYRRNGNLYYIYLDPNDGYKLKINSTDDGSAKFVWRFESGDPYDVYMTNLQGLSSLPNGTTSASAQWQDPIPANASDESNNYKQRKVNYQAKVTENYNQSDNPMACLQSFIITKNDRISWASGMYQIVGAYNGLEYKPIDTQPDGNYETSMPYYICMNTNNSTNDLQLEFYRSWRNESENGSNPNKAISQITFTEVTQTYTFHIINNSGEEAIYASTTSALNAGATITESMIPDILKSPVATNYTFYPTAEDAAAGSNALTRLPYPSHDVYVRYTTDGESLDLTGGTDYYVSTNGNYLYASSASAIGMESTVANLTDNTYKWKIIGNDAYQLTLKNVGNNNEVTYNVSSGEAVPNLSASGSKFFLRQSSTGKYELVAVTANDYSTTDYYTLGVDNNTLKLYSKTNHPYGDAEIQTTISTRPVCSEPTITFNGSQVTITAVEGTTIRYTTNGSDPSDPTNPDVTKVSDNTVTFTIPLGATAINAVAVRTSDDDVDMSVVATQPLTAYTYNIVDTEGEIAIKCTVNQPAGLTLSNDYASIPEAIRSPYLAGETVTFYSTFTEGTLSNAITETPTEGGNIYVSYTTDHLDGKPLALGGTTPFKIQVNSEYIYSDVGNLSHTASDGGEDYSYQWKLAGGDPYRVKIQNMKHTRLYFNWSTTPSASLTLDEASNFILLGGSAAAPDDFDDQVELMAATGADINSNAYYNVGRISDVGLLASDTYPHGHAAIQVLLKSEQRTTTFHIIDLHGHIVIEQSGNFSTLAVPEQWRSPLVQAYHFYALSDFRVSNDVYTLRSGHENNEIDPNDFLNAPSDIYVTYEPSNTYDLDGSENRATDGMKYLLKFAGGTSFQQENGKDGFETTADEGIYPYINGEGGLFVYGQDKLDATEGAVGSTRTRWAWYLEGGDPYRLRISSMQTRTDGNPDEALPRYSYLRTYMPKGYDKVVTGVISNNSIVFDASDDAHALRHQPTDYMILNGTNGHFRLVTSDVVDDYNDETVDERRTVTSFENYWKTNPTAANVIHDKYPDAYTVGTTPTDAQIEGALTTGEGAKGWHSYNVWAYGSTWTSSKKTFPDSFNYGPHWFKTINVGTETDGVYNGDFDLEEYDLDGALILLDQHGWEVMRKPITNRANDKESYAQALRKYDSPMVRKYHFWTNFKKEDGYHKYKPTRGVSDSKDTKEVGVGTSLADYPEVFSGGTLADIYVTYQVMDTYREGYNPQATEPEDRVSEYLIRQGEYYAKTTDGNNITPVSKNDVNLTTPSSIGNELRWYVKPNVNIDAEMGYQYIATNDKTAEQIQAEMESAYYSNTDPIVHDTTNGQNGFDPYNLQIESVAHSGKLFTTNATGTGLYLGGLIATYADPTQKTVTLQSYTPPYPNATTNYYDTQELHVSNSTFMAVSDDNGNIRLMPRFDHHNVVTSLNTLDVQLAAASYGDESGTQTTLFILPVTSSSSTTTPENPEFIDSSDDITDMNGYYKLNPGFEVTKVIGTAAKPFTGMIDGQLNTIDGVNRPLVAYADGAIIKNVIVKTASINAGNADGNAGAICCQATGATRIYNCGILPTTVLREDPDDKDKITGFGGSHVRGSANVGGIVGLLDGNARVINCFSYATITGGTTVAGIVGNIGYGENVSITQSTVGSKPMVVNCMFYGDITGGTNIAPVYGGVSGAMIKNDADTGVNPYCYFRKEASFHNKTNFPNLDSYKRSWPAEEKNLTRFEYYRSILNSNKRLCTWWVNGTNNTAPTDANVESADIAKWVLDPSIAPYPILKKWDKYPSIINPDPDKRIDPSTKAWVNRVDASDHWETHAAPDTDGQILGSITVSFDGGDHYSGSTPASKPISITAMDTESYDYCYGKIQLPYYNEIFGDPDGETWSEKYGDNYGEYVVTGWEITSVTGGTPGTFVKTDADGVKAWESGFNFADRKCTDKDKYSVSGRVFAQGGYYYVPEGVSAITIKAHWGKAVYLANRGYSIDRVNVTNLGYKLDKAFSVGGTIKGTKDGIVYDEDATIKYTFQGQNVYDDLQNAIKALGGDATNSSNITVYDQAIVLIGNHQVKNGGTKAGGDGSNSIGYNLDSKWHPFTIMSADFDYDNEPDYCLQLQFRDNTDRPGIQPVRFDFLPVIELGLAIRHNKLAYAIGVFVPQGHFEITETSFMRSTQFEWDCGQDGGSNRIDNNAPVILNGGEFDQLAVRYDNGNRTGYFLLGGHLWFHRFAPGTHPHTNANNKAKVRLCAVNAIGGDYPEFYLSGLYKANITPRDDQGNPHCYIDGGNFGYIYGAGYEKINGNVTFKVNHSMIGEFYGGGINGSKPIGGNIDVTIDNSQVTKYCGGPMVGDMTGRTVTTRATGTTFGVFYGGGNGGNSYYRQLRFDGDQGSGHIGNWTSDTYSWNTFTPLDTSYDDGSEAGQTGLDKKNENKGYHAEYEFEVFNQSNGVADQITQRGFIRWIQFGKTTTGNVSNTLTDCTVNTNFFGGGNLATVAGTVTSTLTSTKVKENVFGAGYSASIPTFTVHDKTSAETKFPSMDFAGTITDGYIPNKKEGNDDIEYEWTNELDGKTMAERKAAPAYYKMVEVDGESVKKWYCYTWNPLKDLGAVLKDVTLTLDGNTVVGTAGNPETGNVYGGGDASAVGHVDDPNDNEDEDIIANTTVNLQGNTRVLGNVFGGGNEGLVNGSATVNIRPVTPTTPSPSRASGGSGEGTGEESGEGIGK